MASDSAESAGYAPAAGPFASTAIRTGTRGLATVQTTIDRGDVRMPVYAAWPEDGPNRPVVLVICEAFGLHEHIKDIARRFAHEGYFAIAPDLMLRQGDPMSFSDTSRLVSDLLIHIPDGQVMADLDACVDHAASAGGDVGRLSATGFCWGGRWTWLYAEHRPLSAAVVWYGIVDGAGSGVFPSDPKRFPAHPIDIADRLQAPVVQLQGGRDEAIPLSTIDTMRDRLANGSEEARQSKIIVYPEAGHAFFADYRENYDPLSAADAWKRCLDWIGRRTKT